MRIAIRADASLAIGTGHVMRCATLGQALRIAGHSVQMICRDLPGQMVARLAEMGFETTTLPAPAASFQPGAEGPAHAAWAMVPWQTDAAETRAALHPGTDWLIVDHYAFDHRWQTALRHVAHHIMVIDDLADRAHDCDLLLDANAGRIAADYDGLLPLHAERLISPHHALLRPEFALARDASRTRRQAAGHALRHALIFMGGADLPDATGAILRHLSRIPDLPLTALTVVMGTQAPALARVRAQAAGMPIPTQVLTNVADMAALMAQADLAIGAAGGTAWERCASGLPTLLVTLADNQRGGAAALETLGAAVVLGDAGDAALGQNLTKALRTLNDPRALGAMSQAAARLVDGKGTARAVAALEAPLTLRAATEDDATAVWAWRETLDPMALASGPNPPLADHLAWFARALIDPNRHLLIADAGTPAHPVGHLRLDHSRAGAADISILLAPDARGRGLGLRLLTQALTQARAMGLTQINAQVHADNTASRALFAAAGFQETTHRDGFLHLTRRP